VASNLSLEDFVFSAGGGFLFGAVAGYAIKHKTWNEFASQIQGPAAKLDPGYTCLKLSPQRQMPELSSLNFILRKETDIEHEKDEKINELRAH
jgi:hypothetical protein